MESDTQLPADFVPLFELRLFKCQVFHDESTAFFGKGIKRFQSTPQNPGHHHVGVGIVVNPGFGGVRVPIMKLIRSHDLTYFVAAQ